MVPYSLSGRRTWLVALLLGVTLTLTLPGSADSEDEEESQPLNISIACHADVTDDVTDWTSTCDYVKQESGRELRLACHLRQEYTSALEWLHPNGSLLGPGTPDVTVEASNVSAALTLHRPAVADAGNYTCRASNILSVACHVDIYDMPTYFWESVIILSINAALVALFLVCMARSIIAHRSSLKDIATFKKSDYAPAKSLAPKDTNDNEGKNIV